MATPKAAKIPPLIYGTAWKKDQSRVLVKQALLAGFRGVDTAAQPKHYQEDLVGQGIRDALKEAGLKREDLYIQTKFTSVHSQDPNRMPYDPKKSITDQVNSSISSSLNNLRTKEDANDDAYIDCLVLHSPYPTTGQTQEAWQAMEKHVPKHARTLGLSNVYQIEVLQTLYESATVKPQVVQNRFYAQTGYDADIRNFCVDNGLSYQSFWTLTGNPDLLKSSTMANFADKTGVSKPIALYSLVLGLGNTSVLDGTTNPGHMKEDLDGVAKVQQWKAVNASEWRSIQSEFQTLIDV